MNVVYIPQCLYGAIRRSLLSTNDLKDINRLLSTLSAEDVAFYLHANSASVGIIPKEVLEFAPNLVEDIAFPQQLEKRIKGLMGNLKHSDNKRDIYEEGSFLISDCTYEDLIVLTHVKPTEEIELTEDKKKFIFFDRLVEQLFTVKNTNTVMSSSVMRAWIESAKTA